MEFYFKELTTVILHYPWLISSRWFYYYFFSQLHTEMLWPSLKWSWQQQGKQSPIYAITDFKDRKALQVFIHFFILSPERMFLFSVCSVFQHFPVFLWLNLYAPSVWFQYLHCFTSTLIDFLTRWSLLFGLTTLLLTLHIDWLLCLPKSWESFITTAILWMGWGKKRH